MNIYYSKYYKPIAKQYAAQVSQLKQLKPTPEMVEEFKEDWIDFTCRLI